MKMRNLILAIFLFSSYIICSEAAKNENKIDVVGEAYNTDSRPVDAVSYGVANNKAYSLPSDVGFMKPEMVVKLADVILPPKPGPKEAVDEVK